MHQPETTSCLNCGEKLIGNYCNACGQAATVERYTFPAFAHEAYGVVRKIDLMTMAVTVRELLKRPGEFVREYLAGKRVGFVNPAKFFFYSFVAEIVVRTAINRAISPGFVPETIVSQAWAQTFDFAATVFWGVLWRSFFSRSGLNWAECSVAALFFQAQTTYIALAILIVTVPIRYAVPASSAYLDLADVFVAIVYSYVFAISLFEDSTVTTIIKQTILVLLFFVFLIGLVKGLGLFQ